MRLIREDGRNQWSRTPAALTIVISLEVGQVFRPGVASFYTADFYRACSARLRARWTGVQFVPLAFLTAGRVPRRDRQLPDVFPQSHALVQHLGAAADRRARRRAHAHRVATRTCSVSQARIRDDLRYSHTGGPSTWLNQPRELEATFLAGPRGLAAMARSAPRYRDDRPVLEYATTRVHESESLDIAIARYVKDFLDSPRAVLEVPAAPESLPAVELARQRNLAAIEASVWIRQATLLEGTGRDAEIQSLLERAVRVHPGSLSAHRGLGSVAQRTRRPEEAQRHFEAALHIDPLDVASLRGLATGHLEAGRFAEARSLFETVLALRPEDADAHNNLGVVLASQGDVAAAVTHFQEAVRLRPDDRGSRQNLERAQASLAESRVPAR